jgi:salicylate hydroxylase
MAIEDAVVLAEYMDGSKDDLHSAFNAYEKARYLRTARIVLESRSLWEFYHLGGIEAEVRNDACRAKTMDETYQCLAWIYDGVKLPKAGREYTQNLVVRGAFPPSP